MRVNAPISQSLRWILIPGFITVKSEDTVLSTDNAEQYSRLVGLVKISEAQDNLGISGPS